MEKKLLQLKTDLEIWRSQFGFYSGIDTNVEPKSYPCIIICHTWDVQGSRHDGGCQEFICRIFRILINMIICSAIKYKGIIYTGIRHHNCITLAYHETGDRPIAGSIQGFIRDNGKFLNRWQAAQHAIACGQVVTGKAKIQHIFNGHTLYSEDLW